MNKTINWLLDSEPYTAYRTRLDLLGQSESDPEVSQIRSDMLDHPQIRHLIEELGEWPGNAINNHKKAGLLIHKLAFAAQIGLDKNDPGMDKVISKILCHLADDGIPELLVNFPKVFGGSGQDTWGWTLCDTPTILFALNRMGAMDPRIQDGLKTLTSKAMDNGWPCAASPNLGKFKGPGKRSNPCPYATLLMLSALAANGRNMTREIEIGAHCLLDLWTNSQTDHPFLFYMGTDFRKLKAPFIWYDILHVTDVLSRFRFLHDDLRLLEMVSLIRSKANPDRTYTPESVWMAWKTWDFGQKTSPSPWLTFLVLRVLNRLGQLPT